MQIASEGREGRVIGEPLKQFADVRNPEGPFEAGPNLVETFGKGQSFLLKGTVCAVAARRSRVN